MNSECCSGSKWHCQRTNLLLVLVLLIALVLHLAGIILLTNVINTTCPYRLLRLSVPSSLPHDSNVDGNQRGYRVSRLSRLPWSV